ncbi:MAG: hypothetical protein ACRDJH_09145 [Thermomicrobiales bacterium]
MIVIAFVAFAILLVAWLLAPNGDFAEKTAPAQAPAPAPSVPLVDAPAPVS